MYESTKRHLRQGNNGGVYGIHQVKERVKTHQDSRKTDTQFQAIVP